MPLLNDTVFLLGYRRGPTNPDQLVFIQCQGALASFDVDGNLATGLPVAAMCPTGIAAVALSGAYSDLLGRPTLGTAAAQNTSAFDASGVAATAQAFAIQRANHTGTQIASTISGLAAVATSGAYSDLTGKPSFATVATSGAYADLTGRPTLATVATSGSYADLSNRPTNVSTWTNDAGYIIAVPAWSFTNGATRAIQTVAAAANGWQLSSTRNATVSYSVSISTTTSIGGPAAGYVVLEVCSTNSSTAANWTEIARTSNSQTATLALALQLVTVNGSTMTGIVPPGYYVRMRSVVSSGTVVFAYLSGQEVLQ